MLLKVQISTKVVDDADLDKDLEHDLFIKSRSIVNLNLVRKWRSSTKSGLHYSKPEDWISLWRCWVGTTAQPLILFLSLFLAYKLKKEKNFCHSHTTIVKMNIRFRLRWCGLGTLKSQKLALQELFTETKHMNEVNTFLATLELVKGDLN